MEANITDMNLETMLTQFHFMRPWWLLAVFALIFILMLLKKIRYYQSPWQHFLPKHLAESLLENAQNKKATVKTSNRYHWLKPFVIGVCTIIALAGPAWKKLPQPVYQLNKGAVVIMDMSYSMYATDIKPNRLTRARYKAIDLLKLINEGDIGLIAYAGDAFIISPLTQDDNNIALLLPALSPDIMPVAGANALSALMLADNTLKNSGHVSGDIYWFTDDLDNDELSDVFDWSSTNNHSVNILGIGSTEGGPIKLSNGKLLKDNKGAIVVPKLPESRLASFAQETGGVYRTITNDNSDIDALTAHLSNDYDEALTNNMKTKPEETAEEKQVMQGDQYQEEGPWLLLIILPLLLTYFRRGSSILAISWLIPLSLTVSLSFISPPSFAAQANGQESAQAMDNASSNSTNQLWQDLWKTSDQQAQQHYQREEYKQAADQFNDSQWQGSAQYKAGDYEKALESFKQSDSAQSLYNQGNALAQLQQYEEAIDAYNQALAKDPNLTDAKNNLEVVKKAKQEKQEQEKNNDQNSKDDSNGESKDSQDSQSGDNQQEDQQGQNEQNQKGQNQDSQDKSQQDQSQSQSQPEGKDTDDAQDSQDAQQQGDKSDEESEQDASQATASDKEPEGEPSDEQLADSKAKETNQKHQQILNKVTDDPYLLLRNKMSLEYQKRKHDGSQRGVTKQW